MADKRVRDMSAASALVGTELFYSDDGASDVKVTANQIRDFSASGGIYVHLNREYGAVGDGVTNNSTAFANFTNDYRFQDVVAYLAPGEYHWNSGDADWLDIDLGQLGLFNTGGNLFILIAYGASIIDDANTNMAICGRPPAFDNSASNLRYPINDASPGDLFVQLTNIADAANLSKNMWVLLTAFHQQLGDQPVHNPYYFEFRQIEDIDLILGQVYFTHGAVTDGPYLTSYPNYTSQFGQSLLPHLWVPGGTNSATPATGNKMWAQESHIYGLTFPQENPTGMAISIPCRSVKLVDCVFGLPPDQSGPNSFNSGPLPSHNYDFILNNCILPFAVIEVDKVVERLVFRDCEVDTILCQSGNGGSHLTIDGCEVGLLWGTTKRVYIQDSNIGHMDLGPRFTGPTQSVTVVNSHISELGDLSSWKNSNSIAFQANYTISGGRISFPIDMSTIDDPPSWAIPNGKAFFQLFGSGIYVQPFTILRVYQIGPDVVMDTTLPDTLSATISGDSNFRLIDHPCPNLAFINCTGSTVSSEIFGTPNTVASPLWGSKKYTYKYFGTAPEGYLTEDFTPNARGYITSITCNVVKPYTGVGSGSNVPFQFFPAIYPIDDWNGPIAVGAASINTRTAGKRTILPGKHVFLDSLDTIDADLPAIGAWSAQSVDVNGVTDDISAEDPGTWPIIEFEIIVDQQGQQFIDPPTTTLTISGGSVTISGHYHLVDTEAAAASDDLDTIIGGGDGYQLILRAANSARTVVVKDGVDNLQLAGDMTLDNEQDTIQLMYDSALGVWLEIARSNNGA